VAVDPSAGARVDDAFTALFVDSYPAVLRAAELATGDPERARDATQDAFVQLLVRWDRVSRYDNPGAWVRRVAIREAVRGARRDARRHGTPSAEATASPDPDVGASIDVDRALAVLPLMQRAAVVLHHLVGVPTSEVAGLLGCRPATARVHLHRGRRRLAELLGADEEQPAGGAL
jgi:RNA polymerase sigma factor (sigma-70 family)